jgi:hypothetical protein
MAGVRWLMQQYVSMTGLIGRLDLPDDLLMVGSRLK